MPTFTRYIVATALVGILVGCRPQSSEPTPASRPSVGMSQSDTKELDVAEAVFRHQFDHNASGAQRNVDYFFVALENGDPPQQLLARLSDVKPRVLPASLATSSASEGVKHKESGGSGLIFRVSDIKWLDANTAEVQGGYYEAGLSSSGNVYRVERRGSNWSVTKDEMPWIS